MRAAPSVLRASRRVSLSSFPDVSISDLHLPCTKKYNVILVAKMRQFSSLKVRGLKIAFQYGAVQIETRHNTPFFVCLFRTFAFKPLIWFESRFPSDIQTFTMFWAYLFLVCDYFFPGTFFTKVKFRVSI